MWLMDEQKKKGLMEIARVAGPEYLATTREATRYANEKLDTLAKLMITFAIAIKKLSTKYLVNEGVNVVVIR